MIELQPHLFCSYCSHFHPFCFIYSNAAQQPQTLYYCPEIKQENAKTMKY